MACFVVVLSWARGLTELTCVFLEHVVPLLRMPKMR